MTSPIRPRGVWLDLAAGMGAWIGRQGTVAVEATDGVFDATAGAAQPHAQQEAPQEAQAAPKRPASAAEARRQGTSGRLPRRPQLAPTYNAEGVRAERRVLGAQVDLSA